MTSEQAKAILALYRPGSPDAEDPYFAPALSRAREDSALADWFARHCASYQSLQKTWRQLPVPADLMENILAGQKILKPSFGQRYALALAAAAAVLILAALTLSQLNFRGEDRFENFRSRMVSSALRSYEMDIVTNRTDAVRAYLETHGAPADYQVPKKLAELSTTGGGVLRWRNHPVSMHCFDRGQGQMVFLFVIHRSAMPNPPAESPQIAKENKLLTMSWSEGDRTYVLAGPDEPGFEGKYR